MAPSDEAAKLDLTRLRNAIINEDEHFCRKLQEGYFTYLPDTCAPLQAWDPYFQREDHVASLLIPEDIAKEFVPRKVSGNGDCLFNAASVLLTGNQDLSFTLRLLTAAEIYLHAPFYAHHPRFSQVNIGMSEMTRFMMSLSSDVMDGRNRIETLRQEAIATCSPKNWAGLMQMLAMTSVLRRTIFSVYPNSSPGIRPLFHGQILPRDFSNKSPNNPLYIMWSRDSAFDNTRGTVFQPNHFVPLSSSSYYIMHEDDFPPLSVSSVKSPSASSSYSSRKKSYFPKCSSSHSSTTSLPPQSPPMCPSSLKPPSSPSSSSSNKKDSSFSSPTSSSSPTSLHPASPSMCPPTLACPSSPCRSSLQNKESSPKSPTTHTSLTPPLSPTSSIKSPSSPSNSLSSNESSSSTKNLPSESPPSRSSPKGFPSPSNSTETPSSPLSMPPASPPTSLKRPSSPGSFSSCKVSYVNSPFQSDSPILLSPPPSLVNFSSNHSSSSSSSSSSKIPSNLKSVSPSLPSKGVPLGSSALSLSSSESSPPSSPCILEDTSPPVSPKSLPQSPSPENPTSPCSPSSILPSRSPSSFMFHSLSQPVPSESAQHQPTPDNSPSLSMYLLHKPSSRHSKRNLAKAKHAKHLSTSLFRFLKVKEKSPTPIVKSPHKQVPKSVSSPVVTKVPHSSHKAQEKCFSTPGKANPLHETSPETSSSHISPESQRGSVSPLVELPLDLPLCVGENWYNDRGRLELKNRARSERRAKDEIHNDSQGYALGTCRSKVEGSLASNLNALEEKIRLSSNTKEQSRLRAILAVGKHIEFKFPVMSTQEAGKIYQRTMHEFEPGNDKPKSRPLSISIYETLSTHLNLLQIYIRGKAFILENKDTPLLDAVNNFKQIFDSVNVVRSQMNSHFEEKIGGCFKTALQYLDTERDRDTMKYILAEVTSVNFVAKLQGTSNKRSIQKCVATVPQKLRKFEAVVQKVKESNIIQGVSSNEKRGFLRRQIDLAKERELRHRYKGTGLTGRKLKFEEFPDIPAILEYEFGEGDRSSRGGGGLESHSKLRNDILYRAADNKTNMAEAREALLSLSPENFTISISSCYNYTQNFRKGTRQALRHHEGKNINACISLHKAPDTAPIKELVINVHWSTANVNAILDEAAENPNEFFVDSYDTKEVVRPTARHTTKTWRKCEYEDHTYDQSRTNAITPMTHLFLKTEETHRQVNYSKHPKTEELHFRSYGRKEIRVHLKRTGRAVTLFSLSNYEPETVFRSINEVLFLMTVPALDTFFRNPESGKLKESFVFVVDNGVNMPRSPLVQMLLVRLQRYLGLKNITQTSYAEYHSKRNPVERVHAVEEKALGKHGPFSVTHHEPDTEEHVQAMENMAEDVRKVFSHTSFGGQPILALRSFKGKENYVFDDEEDIRNFLSLTEQRKLECSLGYKCNQNKISEELSNVWGVDSMFAGEYAEDYERLMNTSCGDVRTAWKDKYTTTIYSDSSLFQSYSLQPIPDYVRWFLTGGEMHYLPYEQRRTLQDGPWNSVPELFLPTRILHLIFISLPNLPDYALGDVQLICWCPKEDVTKYLDKKAMGMEADYRDCLERQRWSQHSLYKEKKATLEQKCKGKGLDCRGTKHQLVSRLVSKDSSLTPPPNLQPYTGDISVIPCEAKYIARLPLSKIKEILHFHNIRTEGCKDQLVLRALAVRTGTTHLLFMRELEALKELIGTTRTIIREELQINIIGEEVLYRERTFKRDVKPSLSDNRPRERASVSNKEMENPNRSSIPKGLSISNLTNVLDDLEKLIDVTMEVNREKRDTGNVTAICTPGTRVSVLWSKEDAMLGWKPGWYNGVVRRYNEKSDEIDVEYSSEQGECYSMKVRESVQTGSLKVMMTTCTDTDLYDQVTEIGARILVRWAKDDVKGSGWKGGWYAAEVQEYDPDDDTITIIYEREPSKTYEENVTLAISRGQIKLSRAVF